MFWKSNPDNPYFIRNSCPLTRGREGRHELAGILQRAATPSGSCGADGILSHRSGKIYKYRSALKEKVDDDNSLNTGIGTYGVKPADGGGEEYEDEGAGERVDGG
ncbi:MAG: hypothetical protein OIN88_02740 [Candidatus Methanoperedens sp.]|nr:hypothetical protein [Candidatus Methanoperedens sp.]MCZ7360751.1 hypothetical protein [Candidatus Methanoperedens sp.]